MPTLWRHAGGVNNMRLWKKLLIGTLALLLALVAGGAVFISQLDPNEYRGELAGVVEHYTGRELLVGGDLHIKLLPVPSVEANDVSFANAPWASQPHMLQAKRVRAVVALWPLLKGRVVITRFVAIEPKLFLETDAEGKGNWEFGDVGASVSEDKADGDAPSGELAFAINRIRIERAGLAFLDGKTESEAKIGVTELTIGSERPGGRLVLSLRADYGDLPVKLDGKLGAASAIRRNQPIEVDLEGALGVAEFSIRGAVGNALEGKDLRLDVALNSESTKKISDLAGVDMEEFGPLDVKFRLLEQAGYFHLESLAATARPRDTDASISAAVKNFAFDLASGTAGAAAQGAPMTVDLELAFGDARLHVDGDVGKPLEGRDLRLGTTFETQSTIPLTALAGFDFEEVGPVKLTLTLVERDGSYDFDDMVLTARPRGSDASVNGSVKGFVPGLDGSKAQPEAAKVDVTGAVGGAEFSITGDIGNPMEGRDLRLNVALAAKSSVRLSELAGVDVEEVGPLNVKLTVTEKNGRFDLGNINMTAQPRGAHVTIKGSVIDIVDNPQPNLDVALSAKTLRQLDETLPDVGPVHVSAKVQPSGKVIDIQDLIATVGKSDLSGSASVDIGAERPSVSAKLHARVIDLAQFLPPAEESGVAAADKPSDGRVFPDDPLPFDALEKVNGDIALAVDRLITRKLALDKVNVVARLENGDLNIKPTANISGGTVGATIHIDTRTQPTTLAVDIDAKKVSIGALTKQIRGYETSKGMDSNLLMKLRGQGDSVRALMGGLDGDVQLEIGEGRLSNDALDRVGADLMTQIVGVAVPNDDKGGTTQLNCGVLRFAIQDGDAIADQTLVLETEKVLLQGGGLVDLKTEELDLCAKLAARKGIRLGAGTLSSLARVQGTLAKPELGTDLKGVVKAGAKVGIAVVTVGLSLVAESVYGHISEDDHPCQAALAREIEITPTEYKAQKSEKQN